VANPAAARAGDIAFPADAAARLAGISRRRLDYWTEHGIVEPSVVTRVSAQRTVRLYAFNDLMALLVASALRQHVSLQHIRAVVDHLREREYGRPLNQLKFAVVSGEIYFQHADGTWEGGHHPDQIVLHQVIDLRPLRARILGATMRPVALAGRVASQRGRLGSKPVFAGTRIPVATVRGYLDNGFTPAQVLKAYPALTLEDVAAAQSA
jgi:uncharacterized protein (DUF433 family)/DNA-binding transcriptional MerR regulator